MRSTKRLPRSRRHRAAGALAATMVSLLVATPAAAATTTYAWTGSSLASFTARKSGVNSSIVEGASDSGASDGKVLQLNFKNSTAGTGKATEIASKASYQYGTFTQRMRTANCAAQPNAGIVTGAFTFFNDGTDGDGDGMTDNSEIDFEVLCARPDVLYMSIWTDYNDSDGKQSRVTRTVDLDDGLVLSTDYWTDNNTATAVTGAAQATPSSISAVTGFNSSTKYYDYIVTWSSTRVTFKVKDGTTTTTLWDFTKSTRIPTHASQWLTNVWHTNEWTPPGFDNAIEAPVNAVRASLDTTTITSP